MNSLPPCSATLIGDDPCLLTLRGEFDLAQVPVLRRLLAQARGDIEVDCSGVTFIDCAGLAAVQEARVSAAARGRRLVIVATSPAVSRVATVGGFVGLLPRRPTRLVG